MKKLIHEWRKFISQQVQEFLPNAEIKGINKIGSSALSRQEQIAQDMEKYGFVRGPEDRDIDIEVLVSGISPEDVDEWAFSEEAEDLEMTYNYDVQLRIVENWRKFLKEDYDERMYEFRASLVISKDVGGDKSQTFSEIRAIDEVVTVKQEPDSAEENESDYFSELVIKFIPEKLKSPQSSAKELLHKIKTIPGVKKIKYLGGMEKVS